jgi:hypothetical protein
VPLRPMTLGTILAASFQVMRRNPRTTLVPGLLVAVALALSISIGLLVIIGAVSRIGTTTNAQDAEALAAGSVAVALLVALGGGALSTVAAALLQAIIVTEVARGTVGEKLTLGQIWAAGRGRFGAVIGYTALLILAVTIGIVLFYAIIFGLISGIAVGSLGSGSGSGNAASIAGSMVAVIGFTVVGGLGASVLWLWLNTKLAFVPAALVLERLPLRQAIVRSWRLSNGYFWRTLGILLLVQVMISIATQIVATPLSFLASFGTYIIDPTGAGVTESSGTTLIVVVYAVIAGLSAIGMVILSATASLLYLDLRMRKEGLDLELSRYVEARQAGAQVPDPYLPRPAP